MNSPFYFVVLALLVVMASAEELQSKKEVVYNPYAQITDADKNYSGGQNTFYYQQPRQPQYYQLGYPYNQQYYTDYQRSDVHPYAGYQQYGYPASQYGYAGQYDQQHFNPYAYPGGAYSGSQSAPGYYYQPLSQISRQAPPYPSPGAQPIHPPVPHPFYHVAGTYYPPTTTTKPTAPK